jgi:lysophospholipase L1-like esterase
VPQRHRRSVRRHVHLRLRAAIAGAALLALAGCGADERSTSETSTAAPDQGGAAVRVAALGDSITAGNPAFDPDPAQRAALGFGDDQRSQYEHWAERALAGGRAPHTFSNCGVFGERTDEIAQRLDACADGADALIVQGGINDIAQGRPIGAAADDLRSMVTRGRDLGLDIYLANVLPWNNGHPRADEPIADLNREIAAIGAAEDVPVLDFHDALEDPAEPGVMAADLTADGDHPSIEGYRLLGELVARELLQ